MLEQNEISILGGVRYSTGHSPGQCNLIGPPLSSGLGRDDLQQSLLTGVILWISDKIYFPLYQDIFFWSNSRGKTGEEWKR